MIRSFFCIALLLSISEMDGQNFTWANHDQVYQSHIKTVQFHVSGLFVSMPIARLGESTPLTLQFDDLEGGYKRYLYTIVHCNADWQPSNLSQMEYIEGFEEEEIRTYTYSAGTFQDYTHYVLNLPNEYFRWTLSGNYLLHVYEDRGEIVPVLTRRFMVVEPQVTAQVSFKNPSDVSKMRSHQELDFQLNIRNFRVISPLQELEVSILQNGRWDNAMTGITALYERNDLLIFDYQDRITFEAGKEFRQIDTRSLKFRSEFVQEIERDRFGYFIYAAPEQSREFTRFTNENDLNGNFVIGNHDKPDPHIQSEYVTVQFYLKAEPFAGSEVFLIGEITDWQCKEEFRMRYIPDESGYILEARLKQGHYNYYYTLKQEGEEMPSTRFLEGNWHETSNEYTLLTYYREIGSRYDRLVGAQTVVYN